MSAADHGVARICRAGETIELRADRTARLAEHDVLLAADLHIGKAVAFAASGLAVPTGSLEQDLERLASAARETAARRLLILGDLLHHRRGTVDAVVEQVRRWRASVAAEVIVVPGNHDHDLDELAVRWNMMVEQREVTVGPFRLRHRAGGAPAGGGHGNTGGASPATGAGAGFEIIGHMHPVVRLRDGGDDLRLRCFIEEDGRLTLPAFSSFAGGAEVALGSPRRIWAIAGDRVLDLSG